MKTGITGKIIDSLRLVIDRYDIKQGVRKLHYCTFERRNERRRERFRIPSDQPQCPVYGDNRCCGGCPLVKTCDYATVCNCTGFEIGAMGSQERYYMTQNDFEKDGRFVNGEFDWDFYFANTRRGTIKKGLYVVFDYLSWLHITEDQVKYLKDNNINYAKALTDMDEDGYIDLELVNPQSEEQIQMRVHVKGLANRAYESLGFLEI